ncbi:MAG: type II toxin-antitoxin system VapB family antitoxin [Ignavibacteria bacterium]
MRTNIEIDEKLIDEALKLSNVSNKKEIVEIALRKYIKSFKSRKLLEKFGKIKWEGDLNELRKS